MEADHAFARRCQLESARCIVCAAGQRCAQSARFPAVQSRER